MSLIGAVSLTNNQNGLYLGKISVDNADQFTLTSNSIYVNEGVNTIQSAVDSITQGDVIYISSGSYNETVSILDKYNIGLQAPATASTICEVLNGVIVDGTSENVRLTNLQVKGANSQINGVGRHRLDNIVFTGTAQQTNTVEFGRSSSKYITVNNCEFDQYCSVVVSSLLSDVIYFINCNFGGATITLSNTLPLRVIFNNCAGISTFSANATYVGMNVLTSGISNLSTVNINGSAYPPTGVAVGNQASDRVITATATTNALHAESNLTFDGTGKLGVGTVNMHTTNDAIQINDIATQNGAGNVAIGYQCRGAPSCVSIGYVIGRTGMSGTYNVLIGRSTGTALTNGNSVILIGGNAGQQITTGTGIVSIGVSSAAVQTSQSNITICGHNSRATDSTGIARSNCAVFGDNIQNLLSNDNEIQLGKSGTTVYYYTIASRSDARDKADIKPEPLGLNFIEKLKPVQYKWNYREDYNVQNEDGTISQLPNDGSKKRSREHNGFLAQDIQDTMTELNIDFAGLKHGAVGGGTDVFNLDYNEFIAPMIKAIQQLSLKIKALEERVIQQ